MRLPVLLLLICNLGFDLKAQVGFYDEGTIQKIELFFTQANWDQQLDTAKYGKGSYLVAKAVVNGIGFDSVGVKYKGNSSYDSTFAKNPFHIELNTFKDQDYQGFKDIKLSNGYADPSMIREVLSYHILRNYMPAPRSNFAQLYINGQYQGLFANSESVNADFCARNFFGKENTFIKANPNLLPAPNVKSNLKFLPGDSSAYFNYYEMKSATGWNDLKALCDTISNHPNNLESILDLHQCLWMLAFNTLFVNLDSYNGAFAQNYYLYKDQNGKFNPIVWDLNMCFGGFPFLGASNTSLGSLNIASMQTLPAAIHATDAYWPLIKAIQGNPRYQKMYMAHLRTICNEMVSNGYYLNRCNYYLISTEVNNDSKKFYTYNDFLNSLSSNISIGTYSVPGLQTLMDGRLTYFQSNSEFFASAPLIQTLTAGPAVFGQSVSITCSVYAGSSASVFYRHSSSELFSGTALFDDGQHQDGLAGDNIYGCSLPMKSNHLQYYIYAENAQACAFLPARAQREYFNINVFAQPRAGEVRINEFLANNKSDVTNEFFAKEDWIELYNMSSYPLSLDNMYLSDMNGKRALYKFPPGTFIKGEDLMIVWADEFTGGKQLHCGFKLGEEGDEIYLSDGKDLLIDQVKFGLQEKDVSMARCPDGDGGFKENKLPSFDLFNCITGLNQNNNAAGIKVYPNPSKGLVKISGYETAQTLRIYDVYGKLLREETELESEIDLGDLGAGLYVLNIGRSSFKLIIN